ncbi:MAG: DUF928 domain-containing protein [Methylococcales bacterium]|nr:DUF928 domain-containing protein [Methylococcales bacterium]
MKRAALSLILFTVVLLPTQATHAERSIAFSPPQLGTPAARVGGGTRSIKKAITQAHVISVGQIQLFAATKTGLTSLATPTLYWNTSSIPPYEVEISVQQGENPPLLKKNIGKISTTGIQAIRLADYGVTLVAGQDYTWSVALITDPEQRSDDLLADATIRYETPTKPLTDTAVMTKAGYWYDAVAQLVETNSPKLPELLRKEGIAFTVAK